MELMKNLRWLCRVCAVNIKRKSSTSSQSTAVNIFATEHLYEKLQKYLSLDIQPEDELPKVLCTNCFKRLESVHNFVCLAQRTDSYFRDFLEVITKDKDHGAQILHHYQEELANFTSQIGSKKGAPSYPFQENEAGEVVISVPMTETTVRRLRQQSAAKKTSDSRVSMLKNAIPNNNCAAGQDQRISNIKPPSTVQKQHKQTKNPPPLTPIAKLSKTKGAPVVLPRDNLSSHTSFNAQSSKTISNNAISKNSFLYECLNLGSVIKDIDLLKLILKALKWPFNEETLHSQIVRLKNSRFHDVMTDPNLLQDTDIIQILRPYLSAALLQQSKLPLQKMFTHSGTAMRKPQILQHQPAVPPVVVSSRYFSIPADTSVHLVNMSGEGTARSINIAKAMPAQQKSFKVSSPPEKIRFTPFASREIVSDDSTDVTMEVNVDPALYFPPDGSSMSADMPLDLIGSQKMQIEQQLLFQQQQQQQVQQQQQQTHEKSLVPPKKTYKRRPGYYAEYNERRKRQRQELLQKPGNIGKSPLIHVKVDSLLRSPKKKQQALAALKTPPAVSKSDSKNRESSIEIIEDHNSAKITESPEEGTQNQASTAQNNIKTEPGTETISTNDDSILKIKEEPANFEDSSKLQDNVSPENLDQKSVDIRNTAEPSRTTLEISETSTRSQVKPISKKMAIEVENTISPNSCNTKQSSFAELITKQIEIIESVNISPSGESEVTVVDLKTIQTFDKPPVLERHTSFEAPKAEDVSSAPAAELQKEEIEMAEADSTAADEAILEVTKETKTDLNAPPAVVLKKPGRKPKSLLLVTPPAATRHSSRVRKPKMEVQIALAAGRKTRLIKPKVSAQNKAEVIKNLRGRKPHVNCNENYIKRKKAKKVGKTSSFKPPRKPRKPPVKSTRTRICKDCGFPFESISDFIAHRKIRNR